MDIDLLAKMVGELILENDEVALPGVGTFVAELVGASFSDKGFTINPPYRKLSFRQREGDGSLLIDFYARTNSLEKSVAEDILTRFLSEMKEILKTKKFIIFPGLGRLRATKENLFFFVPDENLNIYPEGFGLEPVSLKSHEQPEEVAELAETVEAVAELTAPAAEPAVVSEPAPEPEPDPVPEPVQDQVPEPVVTEPVVVTEPEPEPEPEPEAHHHHHHQHSSDGRHAHSGSHRHSHSHSHSHSHHSRRRKMPVWQKELFILLGLAAAFLILLAIVGRVAPQVVDPFLYNREELEILYR